MGERSARRVKRVLGWLLLAIAAAVVVFGVTHRQEIRDHFSARGFEANARVEQVLDDLQLTGTGERIFLATHPTIDGSGHFNEQCAGVDHSEQGHVLGCYTTDRIHLFDVTDERIQGIVEVTAAHELLHAGWARMGEGDRNALGQQLRAEFERRVNGDPELRERMAVYEHLSDAAFANELHSVLGTEVSDLPQRLEEHYAQWFNDRGALVARFDEYHAVFVQLQDEADALQSEMATLRDDVERRKTEYDLAVSAFNDDAAEFSARNSRLEFAELPFEFERIRGELELRRAELERTLESLQSDIDHYNELRSRLTALSEISAELDQQLDSDLAPVTTRPDA